MIFLLLAVTATFRPAAPSVGDLITVEFEQAVVLDPSPHYEVLAQEEERVVLRTFRPQPFELTGRAGDVSFRNLIVPVTSVLAPDDAMEPAPLKAPLVPAPSRRPAEANAVAALLAVLAWAGVFALARRQRRLVEATPELPPGDRFRMVVEQLRRDPSRPERWAELANATRAYLAATQPVAGRELTTAELLEVLANAGRASGDVVGVILGQGDLEKFSPWGAGAADFDSVADRALSLIPQSRAEEAA